MNRAQMLYAAESIIDLAKTSEEDSQPVVFIPSLFDLNDKEKMEDEYDSLGFFVGKSPLDSHRYRLERLLSTADISGDSEHSYVHLGGLMTEIKKIQTKKGQEMGFFTLEDLKGRLEVVVFPSVYKRTKETFKKNNVIELKGKIEAQTRQINGEEQTSYKIMANKIVEIEQQKPLKRITLFLTEKDDFLKICDTIKLYPGNTEVDVQYSGATIRSGYKISDSGDSIQKIEELCHTDKIYWE